MISEASKIHYLDSQKYNIIKKERESIVLTLYHVETKNAKSYAKSHEQKHYSAAIILNLDVS